MTTPFILACHFVQRNIHKNTKAQGSVAGSEKSKQGSDRSRHTNKRRGIDEEMGSRKDKKDAEKKRSRSRSKSRDGSETGDSKRRKLDSSPYTEGEGQLAGYVIKDTVGSDKEDGANLDVIEQNFSDWSDDSDDDILNQPGEPSPDPPKPVETIVVKEEPSPTPPTVSAIQKPKPKDDGMPPLKPRKQTEADRRDRDNANKELSKRLHEVLDVIGASEYTREKYWECSMLFEIIITFESLTYLGTTNTMSYYQVGSKCEGTTTQGIDSDLDVIHCDDETPVVENLFESKQQGLSYLILTDEDTKPGYVRLQIIKDKCPRLAGIGDISDDNCFIDRKGRVCATRSQLFGPKNISRNGPASTIPGDNRHCPIDRVYALRCRQIPRSANSWLQKTRKYDWPSEKQLKAMGSYGCFFVRVGHPHSNNKASEWRISFSLQERDLMSSLNETQHKCYILLKMIKKDIIEQKAGESISSYHCKTSLFYTIENSHKDFWTNDNLILCIQQCLKRLFIWVKATNCPNYFIPEENMFDKLSVMTLEKIEYVLNDIIESDIKCLYSLICDNVGELLKSKLSGVELVYSLATMSISSQPRYLICNSITMYIYNLRNWLMRLMSMPSNTKTGYMNGVMQLLLYLQHTNHVTAHTTKDVRMAFDSIIPLIQLQYIQCMYVQYLSQGNLSITNIIPIIDCDLISSKLSLASFYIQFEQYHEECKRILVSCEKEIKPFVISVCGCNSKLTYVNIALANKMRFTDMSSKEFRHCITGCMVFHPSQASLVHGALQYEMFRNVFTQPGFEFEMERDYWLNWITVDSQIYLYFLQYLLYSNTKIQAEKVTAIQKIKHVLQTDHTLGHTETAFNLLGWICLQYNHFQVAWSLFCLSWKERPFKNAAKWHMLILLSKIINKT